MSGTVGRRGLALITALIFVTILAMMLVALVAGGSTGSFLSRSHNDRIAALYVAEAGASHALARLEANSAWRQGFSSQPMLRGRGSYSLSFHPDPATQLVGADQSVNNLEGSATVNGPRGELTVPPGTVELVVTAQVGRARRVVHVIASRGTGAALDVAVLSDGRIRLKGNVSVGGIESLDNPVPLQTGLHTNYNGADPEVIRWIESQGSQASISGTVSATAPSGIDLTGAILGGSPATQQDAPSKAFPSIDIASEIASKSSATPANLPLSGNVVLGNGTAEDFYHSGDLVVNGDLELNGATLYIDGKLTVNGSIAGSGGLYVLGDPTTPDQPATTFRGDATISTSNDKKVAIYSRGSVELLGFDGDQFIRDLAVQENDPQILAWWGQANEALQKLDEDLANFQGSDFGNRTVRDRRVEIQITLGPFPPDAGATYNGSDNDTLRKLAGRISASG